MGKPKKAPREKDLTSRYLSGGLDEDRVEQAQRFSSRSKHGVQRKVERTAAMRGADEEYSGDVAALPVGEVVQVYSLYYEVLHAGATHLCVARKTLGKVSGSAIVVGDLVRFRTTGAVDDQGRPEGVIEQVLARQTVLARAESFKGTHQHPIVANAQQMLIVASVAHPVVKWGLVDRMIVAARSGKLRPIVCLNKIDLADEKDDLREVLEHYETLGVTTLRTSALSSVGLRALAAMLKDRTTVLAGHSGVGKSSLIRAIEPRLDIRIGEVSAATAKGRHTTSSARRYALSTGGAVIDTPGVKVFGLWDLTRQNLIEFFPDVAADTAPPWRRASFERIEASLAT